MRNYKAWRRITLPELDLSEEYFTGLSSQIQTDYNKEHSATLIYLQSRVMIVSPLAESIKNCDNIFNIINYHTRKLLKWATFLLIIISDCIK